MAPPSTIRQRRRQRGAVAPWLALLRSQGIDHPQAAQAATVAHADGLALADLSGVQIELAGTHRGRLSLIFDKSAAGGAVTYASPSGVEVA